jgi:hypothetical protein
MTDPYQLSNRYSHCEIKRMENASETIANSAKPFMKNSKEAKKTLQG